MSGAATAQESTPDRPVTVGSRGRRIVSWLGASWVDVALGALGAAMGWVSLLFPFGRDQGLYFYVAREWVLRGSIPYRDVLDHKTPGIYLIHAFAVRLFGEAMWGIRLLDLIGVLLIGIVAATFTVPRGASPARGVTGAAILATSVFHYGFLDFWNTAQSELWYSLLGLASVWAARRLQSERAAQAGAGAFAALAMIMKPPAVWFVAIALIFLAKRVFQRSDRRFARAAMAALVFGGAFVAAAAPIFGYFAAHGALGPMFDIVVGANSYYVTHETSAHTIGDVAGEIPVFLDAFKPVSWCVLALAAAMFGFAVWRRNRTMRDRHLLAALLAVAGFAAVVMQKKFYLLHWVALIGPAAVICANLAADCEALLPFAKKTKAAAVVFSLGILGLFASSDRWGFYRRENEVSIAYLRGRISREEFSKFFALPSIGFWFEDSEKVGIWLRDHSAPNDYVAVRGFQPEIYAVAQRRHAGRFFWTTFLTSPVRAYRRAEWLEEDRAALAKNPPRFVVSLTEIHDGVDSTEWFQPMGYTPRYVVRGLTVLEYEKPNRP